MSSPELSDTRDDDSSHDSDDSSHTVSATGNDFLDLEASEDSEDGLNHLSDEEGDEEDLPQFHLFSKLPKELRQTIWEFFCPDLTEKLRILNFAITTDPADVRRPPPRDSPLGVSAGYWLEQSTSEIRCMSAVHHESRTLVLAKYPDELCMREGIIRYNKDRDVVLLDAFGQMHRYESENFNLDGFAEKVTQLAMPYRVARQDSSQYSETLKTIMREQFRSLSRLFIYIRPPINLSRITWCASDNIHTKLLQTFEKEPGLGEDLECRYCLPDMDRHPSFAMTCSRFFEDRLSEGLEGNMTQRGIAMLPMVEFWGNNGRETYNDMLRLAEEPESLCPEEDSSDPSDLSSLESEVEEDLDEYESEGIDDDLLVQDDEDGESDEESEARSTPDPDDVQAYASGRLRGVPLDEDLESEPEVQFSSPEPEPGHERSADVEATQTRRGAKRRIVSDSEEEDSDAEEPQAKRPRVIRVLHDSDDEEEEDADAAPPQRRNARVVQLDSESSGVGASDGKGGARLDSDEERSSEEEDDESSQEDDSEEEEQPPQRMSLVERLQLHRRENPVPGSDEDVSDLDDEQGSEEDEEEDEGGLLDTMAADSDSEGGGSEEGW
ncbi:hypothetical protein S40293_04005 [Stachybotrys chartarum IBT 40293]|nr:hypothetical protein S40293_04005 [Stachybotrys chartarum IBT 40293]